MADPLVVTALLDPVSQQRFDDLRRTHFPPERNHLDAHVTLFHALPGRALDRVAGDLAALAPTAGGPARVHGLRLLGGGVAYDLDAPALVAAHDRLREQWADLLTRQDAQGLRPHVTVQNKVPPATARALHAELLAGFSPWAVEVSGLALWWYRGGPWEPVHRFPAAGRGSTA